GRVHGLGHRYTDPDAVRDDADFQLPGEVLQVRRHVRFGPGEEMVKDPEHEPVLHLLAFGAEVVRARFLEIMRLLLRLQRHHGRDALPGDEQPAGHGPAGLRLPPAGEEERAPKSAHRPDSAGRVGRNDGRPGGDDRGARGVALAGQPDSRTDGQQRDQRDAAPYRPTVRLSDCPTHRATNTFNRRAASRTVQWCTAGSRSSPSRCSSSGCSGQRIVNSVVRNMVTSRMRVSVPRLTRVTAMRYRGSDTRRTSRAET